MTPKSSNASDSFMKISNRAQNISDTASKIIKSGYTELNSKPLDKSVSIKTGNENVSIFFYELFGDKNRYS